MKEKKLDQFAQLFLDNSKNLYLGDNPEKFIDYLIKHKDQQIWGCDFKNKLDIMSCTINKDLVGFVCFLKQSKNCKNYDFSTQSDGAKVGYIALLCVNKNYRQQKIGSLLISSALEELFINEDVRYVTILTKSDNLPAQNLFIKMGFIKNIEDKNIWLLLDTNQRDKKDFNSLALITNVRNYSYIEHGIKTIHDIIHSFSDLSKLFVTLEKNSRGRNIFSKQALTDAKAIIDKIFSENGYSYSSNFFDSTRFKKLVIPANGKGLLLSNTNISDEQFKANRITDSTLTTFTRTYITLPFNNVVFNNDL